MTKFPARSKIKGVYLSVCPRPSQVLTSQSCQQGVTGGYRRERNARRTVGQQRHSMVLSFCFRFLSTTTLGDLWEEPSTGCFLKCITNFRIPKEPCFLVSVVSRGSFYFIFIINADPSPKKRGKGGKEKGALGASNFDRILMQACRMRPETLDRVSGLRNRSQKHKSRNVPFSLAKGRVRGPALSLLLAPSSSQLLSHSVKDYHSSQNKPHGQAHPLFLILLANPKGLWARSG